MWETWVQSLSWEDPLEKGMVTHSRTLAWRIPWKGTWQPWGCKKSDVTEQLTLSLSHTHTHTHTQRMYSAKEVFAQFLPEMAYASVSQCNFNQQHQNHLGTRWKYTFSGQPQA